MTNTVNYSPAIYSGNGVSTIFSYTFKTFVDTDLLVVLQDAENVQRVLTLYTDYTVEVESSSGGSVTLSTAPAIGEKLIIGRKTPLIQDSVYKTSTGFDAKEVEKSLDELTSMAQELSYTLDRAVKVPIGSGDLNIELPKPDKGKALVWNQEETGLVNSEVDVTTLEETANRIYESIDNIDAVAQIKQDVSDVADIAEDVTICAENIEDIKTAKTSAENAAASAAAAAISEDNAEVWAEGTDEEVQALGGVHSSKGWAEQSAQSQIQSNMGQTDSTQKDYILNKKLENLDNVELTDIADKQTLVYNSTTQKWENGNGGSGSGLEVWSIGIGFIDESKGLQRYANGQVVDFENIPTASLDKLRAMQEDYPDLFETEVNWQAIKTLSVKGQCGKFVLDEDNETVRLPKIVNLQGVYDSTKYGDIVEQSLPNITGAFDAGAYGLNGAGAFYTAGEGVINNRPNYASATPDRAGFDASRSSSVYQDNANVQEESIQLPFFIQIAIGQDTHAEVINSIELNNPYSLLDSKYSDHELDNVSWLRSNGQLNDGTVYVGVYNLLLQIYNGTKTIQGITVKSIDDVTATDYDFKIDTANTQFKLPTLNGSEDLASDRTENLTLLASDSSYTAKANGYVVLQKVANAQQQITAYTYNDDGTKTVINQVANSNGQWLNITLEVSKGETYKIGYSTSGETLLFNFVYKKGNGSLYYYVGETVQNANLINAGKMSEKISDYMASLRECQVVIETYTNGASGYRIWSDGYCEQWGIAQDAVPIMFLKVFKDTSYNVLLTTMVGTGEVRASSIREDFKTVSSMVVYFSANPYLGYWKASGYLAQGQY